MIKLIRAAALSLVLAASGTGVALAAPVQLRLPSPTGPLAVGRTTLHLVDQARPDPWVPEAGARELMISLYYPARPGRGVPAPYISTDEARLLLRAQGLDGVVPAETF